MRIIYLWMFLAFTVSATTDPCLDYTRLDEPDRSASFSYTNADLYKCDTSIQEQWYRSVSGAGPDIPTSFVPTGKCGTLFPLWINDSLPEINSTKEVKVCMSHWSSICTNSFTINVRNCGDFNVYNLIQTNSCPMRYCFGTQLKCPDGESSHNGFSPGCEAVPDIPLSLSVAAGLTDGKLASANFFNKVLKFDCQLGSEPADKEHLRFLVEWYIEDNHITTFADIPFSELNSTCFMGEHWKDKYHMGFHVKCKMRVKYANGTTYGPTFESQFFYAGFKVESSRVDIKERESKLIKIWLTVPFGCERPIWMSNDICSKLSIKLREPNYQLNQLSNGDLNECMFDAGAGAIAFSNLDCGVDFKFENWNSVLTINITARADNTYNDNNRITYIRLKALQLFLADPGWNSASIPDIAVHVADGEKVTMNRQCKAENDPYITTFDGLRLADQLCGEQVMYKHNELPMAVHIMLTACQGRGTASCICGVVVRNDDALFIIDFCEKISRYYSGISFKRQVKQVNCDDKYMKIKQEGRKYEVVLPTGTTVTFAYSDQWINHVIIKPSIFDQRQSSGLCGYFDGHTNNDLKLRDGLIATNQDTFMENWRANDLKLFDHSLRLQPSKVNLRQYCKCNDDDVKCNLESTMAVCTRGEVNADTAEQFFKECAKSRTKRDSYSHHVNKRDVDEDEDVFDTIPIEFAVDYLEKPNTTATWENGWNEILAREKCKEHLESSKLVTICDSLIPNFSADITNSIEECVSDIKHTGGTSFMDSALGSLSAACVVEAKKFENLTNSNSTSGNSSKSLLDDILDASCANNCSGNGICVQENCVCIDGYHGYDCNLRQSNPPLVIKNDNSGLCRTDQRSCRTYGIVGKNMIPGSLTCKAQHFKIFKDGQVETNDKKLIFSGIYVNEFSCKCQIPERLAIPKTVIANGFFMSISNDGKNFSEEIAFINFDSTCYACNNTNMSCTLIGNSEKCTPSLKSKPESEDSTNIGMIVGIVVAVTIAIFAAAAIFIIKTISFRDPKRSETTPTLYSGNGNASKPPLDTQLLSKSTQRRPESAKTISSINIDIKPPCEASKAWVPNT